MKITQLLKDALQEYLTNRSPSDVYVNSRYIEVDALFRVKKMSDLDKTKALADEFIRKVLSDNDMEEIFEHMMQIKGKDVSKI